MNDLVIQPGTRVHIVGIGGAGMSAIARVLLDSGVRVSGSDRQENEATLALQRDGATIYGGHAAENITDPEVVVISSAIKEDNPEVQAAGAKNIPVLKRRDFFKYLLPDKIQIAVAGTHGKTTTTALIVHLLRETGHDPSYIVGGKMHNTGDNAHAGKGRAFVIEADEYDYMFLGLRPNIAVITNMEHDHPDMFPTFQDIVDAFQQFVNLIPVGGTLVIRDDDPNYSQLALRHLMIGNPVIEFGFEAQNKIFDNFHQTEPIINGRTPFIQRWRTADDYEPTVRLTYSENTRAYFHSESFRKQDLGPALVGEHNVANALAALAAVAAYGVSLDVAIPALKTFQGTGRRMEVMGTAGKVTVLSDYGHHPTAIKATLQAIKQRYGTGARKSKIWAVWQPHTYSRTRQLADEFAHAFTDADHVLVTDIYAAREKATATDPTGASMAALIAQHHPDARHSGDLASTATMLLHDIQPGEVVIIFSAGDAPKAGEQLLDALRSREAK